MEAEVGWGEEGVGWSCRGAVSEGGVDLFLRLSSSSSSSPSLVVNTFLLFVDTFWRLLMFPATFLAFPATLLRRS